jgi:hypothetical protein
MEASKAMVAVEAMATLRDLSVGATFLEKTVHPVSSIGSGSLGGGGRGGAVGIGATVGLAQDMAPKVDFPFFSGRGLTSLVTNIFLPLCSLPFNADIANPGLSQVTM